VNLEGPSSPGKQKPHRAGPETSTAPKGGKISGYRRSNDSNEWKKKSRSGVTRPFGFSRDAPMVRSVGRRDALHCKPGWQLRSEGVRCRLSAGLEVD
jgi:hypothetical protein